ncbi:phosphotransferase [Saccharomonospora piscinae]|uniref:phosphotransferase n=1 Tax=Saccharomonospora piscinae TaxID=687388 RepID=UPI00207BCB60|nr:phosphotransferase [Saccharomonospora piscinae]
MDVDRDAVATRRDTAGLLATHYGIVVHDVAPVAGGADLAASLLRVTDRAGRRFAVKRTSGGSPGGLVVAAALATACPGGTPCPVRTRDGRLWVEVDGSRVSVSEWLDGPSSHSATDVTPDRHGWESYGRLLAHLHALPLDAESRRLVPRERFDPGHWVRVFDRVDSALGGDPSAATAHHARLATEWGRHRSALHAVRERALSSADRLARRVEAARFVPCHGDPHRGNVVSTGSGAVALLDFDDAVLAPPERDLMFVLGGGVLADLPVTPRQRERFQRGYGRAQDADAELLTYYRCVRVLEDVAEPATVVLDAAATPALRETHLGHVRSVLSPTGLLAQALGPDFLR